MPRTMYSNSVVDNVVDNAVENAVDNDVDNDVDNNNIQEKLGDSSYITLEVQLSLKQKLVSPPMLHYIYKFDLSVHNNARYLVLLRKK